MDGKVVFSWLTSLSFVGKYSLLWGTDVRCWSAPAWVHSLAFLPLRGSTVLCIILTSVAVNIYSLHFRDLLSSGVLQRFKFQAGISTTKKPPSGTRLPNCQELCGWWMWEHCIKGPVWLKQFPPHMLPGYCSSNTVVERHHRLFKMSDFFLFSSCLHINCYFFPLVYWNMLLLWRREPAS